MIKMSAHGRDFASVLLRNPGFLLSHLGRHARRVFAQAIEPWGLQPPHYGVLLALDLLGEESQQGLSALSGVDRSDMVDLIDTLERKGLVERTRDPVDRRRYAVRLTESGRAAAAEIGGLAGGINDRFFAPLEPEERAQFQRLLEKLFRAHAADWSGPRARGGGDPRPAATTGTEPPRKAHKRSSERQRHRP
jgi:DNA-binding MarR family transcriptional regulator